MGTSTPSAPLPDMWAANVLVPFAETGLAADLLARPPWLAIRQFGSIFPGNIDTGPLGCVCVQPVSQQRGRTMAQDLRPLR